ncbi:tetratricopeptide repeat protein [Phycisphaerae bacterium RAS1]|nr:tetratricopeptide repeat protein [Phycisphaerae bacterium RAS1]
MVRVRILIGVFCAAAAWGQAPGSDPASTQPAGGAADAPAKIDVKDSLQRAQALLESGTEEDLIAAQQFLQDVLRVEPTNADAIIMVGEVALERRDGNVARRYFSDVLKLEENNFRANRGMGELYFRSKMWRQAMRYLETAARVAPPDKRAETLSVLARCYVQDGTVNKALETAQQAVASDAKNVDALQTLTVVRMGQKQFEQALEDGRKLMELVEQKLHDNPADAKLLRQSGQVYQTLVEGLILYHATLHLPNARGEPTTDPIPGKEREIAQVLVRIGEARGRQVVLESRISYLRAVLPYYEKSLKFDDQSVPALLAYARVLLVVERTSDAAEQCRKALEIDPTNVEAQQLLQQIGPAAHEPAAASR